jgi:proline dehydrogenase
MEWLLMRTSNPVMIATHNHLSVLGALHLLRRKKPQPGRIICFAQLYGMGDDLTYGIVREVRKMRKLSSELVVVKYVPYGPLNDAMPYLVRRAEENRGMLGGSILEREVLLGELKRRILRNFGLGSKRGAS